VRYFTLYYKNGTLNRQKKKNKKKIKNIFNPRFFWKFTGKRNAKTL
jgi:hypothetical protein